MGDDIITCKFREFHVPSIYDAFFLFQSTVSVWASVWQVELLGDDAIGAGQVRGFISSQEPQRRNLEVRVRVTSKRWFQGAARVSRLFRTNLIPTEPNTESQSIVISISASVPSGREA